MNRFQEIFDKQKAYFNSDITKSYEWRIEQLDRLEKMLTENREDFQTAVGKDFKTAYTEQVFEVSATLATIAYTKSQLKKWMEPVPAPVPEFLKQTGHTGIVYREPYGVSLIIGPFNGPLILLFHPAVTAISAGNTCILKSSGALINTEPLLERLIPLYFQPEAVTLVTGNREAINELLKLQFDFIFFTGSVPVGKVIMRAAAENLTPVLLELGGQNPAVVDETANIKDAAEKIVWGATAWGGQWCTSPGYAYVHRSVADEFVAACKEAVVSLYGKDPKNNPDFSRIISAKEVKRLAALIDQNKVVAGGESDGEAKYVAPTVLYPVDWSDAIMEEEIFGPMLPVLVYDNLSEAIRIMKNKPKPLAGFIFSRNDENIQVFLHSFSFGGGAVNQVNVHLFIETMPFGGVGNSGIGHYYSKYGFDSLTHAKSILISSPDVKIDSLLPPYNDEKVEMWDSWFHG